MTTRTYSTHKFWILKVTGQAGLTKPLSSSSSASCGCNPSSISLWSPWSPGSSDSCDWLTRLRDRPMVPKWTTGDRRVAPKLLRCRRSRKKRLFTFLLMILQFYAHKKNNIPSVYQDWILLKKQNSVNKYIRCQDSIIKFNHKLYIFSHLEFNLLACLFLSSFDKGSGNRSTGQKSK